MGIGLFLFNGVAPSCGALSVGLLVQLLLTQVLNVDSFLSAFPVKDGRFCEFLTLAEFFHYASLFEFSLEFFQGFFDVFTFFDRNYDHC